jgi:hypothetical protein
MKVLNCGGRSKAPTDDRCLGRTFLLPARKVRRKAYLWVFCVGLPVDRRFDLVDPLVISYEEEPDGY